MCTGEEDASDVKKETTMLAAQFHQFGAALGLPPSELAKISKNCPHDCDQAFYQVIVMWLKQSYDTSRHGCPSWKKLAEEVASDAGGKNPALAQKIAAAHRGKVVPMSLSQSLDIWVMFAASRKRQQNSDNGVPQPKLPRIEDGEECIVITM